VLSGTWWADRTTFDPANLAVPLKVGTFATHFAKQVHWDGAPRPSMPTATFIKAGGKVGGGTQDY
jgi:hypothetical protein